MVDMGYDVWLHSARGVKYSNKHDRDGEWSLAERWNFTWADMGTHDLPASIERVLYVTMAEKVVMAAHSQGTSQSWYALAHN